ncbi:helix-turn-helix domain-containing protein [Alicyclobacillus fastidiosus]|uniref:AraC family transcriptional regulator n=1 Tax=Alicyclobacillus fastidiosus TaxID=392011 RepID=A0ABV5AIQ4_9BACL|nr:AraC family transcriptional regulator [Alicyclobacillus fastidiosus]WEH07784.1 AraC family transcriptional regulator [Alicyclobacillus fastidiosus]
MNKHAYLSFLAPPFPYFVEGNLTQYNIGDLHPNRRNLEYFDIIMVKEGTLFLGEENHTWSLTPGEVLILEPNKHHYPVHACEEQTSFYWLHFHTKNEWREQTQSLEIESETNVPRLHFYSDYYTIHLPKWQTFPDSEELFSKMEFLLRSTTRPRSLSFWETQQNFMEILQFIEQRNAYHDSGIRLAELVEIYIKQNFRETITNQTLSKHFHVHENYLARSMKKVFQCTPLQYLTKYRLNQARRLLLKTDSPLTQISDESGFTDYKYFSSCFRKEVGLSPSQFRKRYRHIED